jgi:hypothetical protein
MSIKLPWNFELKPEGMNVLTFDAFTLTLTEYLEKSGGDISGV